MEGEMKFDKLQLQAIDAHDGCFLVLAPPGCGKTQVLAERIARAVDRGVDPADILCLTFTNRASRGMRDRVAKRLGEEGAADANKIYIGNLHKFCSSYIFENAVVGENSYIIDEDDRRELIQELAPKLTTYSRTGNPNLPAIKYIADLATYITQRRFGQPQEVLAEGPGLLDSRTHDFMRYDFDHFYRIAEKYDFRLEEIPTEYEALRTALGYTFYKKSHSALDFSDLLVLAYSHMLQNPELKRYKWVQIDEIQDLNRLQLAIADILTAPGATVMYLGDEQQAIFSFMGAKLSNLDILRRRCAGNILHFMANYRAPSYLVDITNTYAKEVLHVAPELLPFPSEIEVPGEFDLILTDSGDHESEQRRILKMIDYYTLLSKHERLAILVSRNAQADEISETLSTRGIDNFKISGVDMFRTTSYKTLTALFNVLVNDFDMGAWTRLLFGLDCRITQVQTREIVHAMRRVMLTPSDLLRPIPYVIDFLHTYTDEEAVVFDTETTGLNVLEDDIVQIAAFKIRGNQKVPGSDFNILLHTDRPIPEKLGDKVNPLVAEYASRPHLSRDEGLRMFLEYAGDCALIGHNVTYDYLILRNNCMRTLGEDINFRILDTLRLAKLVAPNLKRYTLEFLIKEFSLQGENAHLADADIEATYSLIKYCISQISRSEVITAQQTFLSKPKISRIKAKLAVIAPELNNINFYIHAPVATTERTIADELRDTYKILCKSKVINSLGKKFDIFLDYINNEWNLHEPSATLFSQISEHLYDITSTLNEGDLVNSLNIDIPCRVFIMTIHKAKGLEFDNVVVLGANDDQFPYWSNSKVLYSFDSTPEMKAAAKAACLEDARKLYVAISRASKRLCISYTHLDRYGHTTFMSRYLQCIAHFFRR